MCVESDPPQGIKALAADLQRERGGGGCAANPIVWLFHWLALHLVGKTAALAWPEPSDI